MGDEASFSLLLAGASVACYSFLGFDAVSTLSEETINPKKTIPIGCIALLALTFDITTSTSFINFGAFATFIFVNLSVISHYYVKGKKHGQVNGIRRTTFSNRP